MHEALARVNFDQDVAALSDAAAARQKLTVHTRTYPILDVTIAAYQAASASVFRETVLTNCRRRSRSSSRMEQPWTDPLPGGVFNGGPHSVKGGPPSSACAAPANTTPTAAM